MLNVFEDESVEQGKGKQPAQSHTIDGTDDDGPAEAGPENTSLPVLFGQAMLINDEQDQPIDDEAQQADTELSPENHVVHSLTPPEGGFNAVISTSPDGGWQSSGHQTPDNLVSMFTDIQLQQTIVQNFLLKYGHVLSESELPPTAGCYDSPGTPPNRGAADSE